jgi:CheY-like chemotaxis protein
LPADLNGSRVLVVDDNQVNRDILQEQLGAWGFDSAATEGALVAKAFLDKAISVGIAVDCLILDYHMPDVNGATLAQELHNDPRYRNIPKILLSSVDQIDHGTLIKAGILQAWLTKPASSKQLRETIIELIHDARLKAGTHVTGLKELANMMRQTPAPVALKPAPQIQAPAFQSPPLVQAAPVVTHVATPVAAPMSLAQMQVTAAPTPTPMPTQASAAPFVLVAEDNEVNQFVVMQILEGLNLNHEIKANGRLAVEAWKERKPTLILMDVSMPEMNGLIATQTIRELEQGTGLRTPIIGLTAHALKGDEERCLNAGMDAYLTKPVSATKLEQVMAKYIQLSAGKAA